MLKLFQPTEFQTDRFSVWIQEEGSLIHQMADGHCQIFISCIWIANREADKCVSAGMRVGVEWTKWGRALRLSLSLNSSVASI